MAIFQDNPRKSVQERQSFLDFTAERADGGGTGDNQNYETCASGSSQITHSLCLSLSLFVSLSVCLSVFLSLSRF